MNRNHTGLTLFLLLATSTCLAAEACPLHGLYRANGELTLHSYEQSHVLQSQEERHDWKNMFSALTMEWRCDRFRAWTECGKPEPCPVTDGWQTAAVTEIHPGEIQVHFPSGLDDDWRLQTEGDCYRIERESRGPYWEYFCRQASE